jgi:aminobenzoyl-glutamate utilization protein B
MANANGNNLPSIMHAVEKTRPASERICAEVWEEAELSRAEFKSVQIHIRELEVAGFTITDRKALGCATAFVAEWSNGKGGAKIGFLPEYDALPGLGNAPVSEQAPRADDKTTGHGCGHNLLGAGCTGAAIALKQLMEKDSVPGTLRVYGCAAEENMGIKVDMARDGLFDDLDAALAWHSAPIALVGYVRTAAVSHIQVEFFGKSAHAGAAPWEGRSALHAAELFAHGVNLMREHVEPTARIQYVIQSGGGAVNVVSDYTRLRLAIRDKDRGRVEATTAWARQIAEGAAMGTQTRTKFEVQFGLWDLLPNGPLIERTHTHMENIGMPRWSEEEQRFARECQKNMKVKELGLATKVMPLSLKEITVGGGTDVGDVSWNAPTVAFVMPTLPLGVGLHTWPVTACGGMSIGLKGAVTAAAVMTATGYDLLTDAKLRESARADFVKRKGNIQYVCALPKGQTVSIDAASMLKEGHDEMVAAPQDSD